MVVLTEGDAQTLPLRRRATFHTPHLTSPHREAVTSRARQDLKVQACRIYGRKLTYDASSFTKSAMLHHHVSTRPQSGQTKRSNSTYWTFKLKNAYKTQNIILLIVGVFEASLSEVSANSLI